MQHVVKRLTEVVDRRSVGEDRGAGDGSGSLTVSGDRHGRRRADLQGGREPVDARNSLLGDTRPGAERHGCWGKKVYLGVHLVRSLTSVLSRKQRSRSRYCWELG